MHVLIAMVLVRRVKCRCRGRQFAQQQSAAVLMNCVLQTCERLLTQTKAKKNTWCYAFTSEKFVRRK